MQCTACCEQIRAKLPSGWVKSNAKIFILGSSASTDQTSYSIRQGGCHDCLALTYEISVLITKLRTAPRFLPYPPAENTRSEGKQVYAERWERRIDKVICMAAHQDDSTLCTL